MTSQATGNLKATLAANIRSARDAAGMTQRQLATVIDTESSLVSKWERAEHRPSDTNLAAIAAALGLDLAWFYTDHTAAAA
jgi:transcriptional regulator with XRE-family HTH domain